MEERLEQFRALGAADLGTSSMAFISLIKTTDAGVFAAGIVSLPQAHAPCGEGAGDDFSHASQPRLVANFEQGGGRGELLEGRALRRERALALTKHPCIAVGDQSLIGKQRCKSDRENDDAARHQERLATVSGDEADEILLGDDEYERPV